MKHVNVKINGNPIVENYLDESGNMRKTVEKALELAIEVEKVDAIHYENKYLKTRVEELLNREKELLEIIKTSVTKSNVSQPVYQQPQYAPVIKTTDVEEEVIAEPVVGEPAEEPAEEETDEVLINAVANLLNPSMD